MTSNELKPQAKTPALAFLPHQSKHSHSHQPLTSLHISHPGGRKNIEEKGVLDVRLTLHNSSLHSLSTPSTRRKFKKKDMDVSPSYHQAAPALKFSGGLNPSSSTKLCPSRIFLCVVWFVLQSSTNGWKCIRWPKGLSLIPLSLKSKILVSNLHLFICVLVFQGAVWEIEVSNPQVWNYKCIFS